MGNSKFQVPAGTVVITVADGCGKSHQPDAKGFVNCEECAHAASGHTFHEPIPSEHSDSQDQRHPKPEEEPRVGGGAEPSVTGNAGTEEKPQAPAARAARPRKAAKARKKPAAKKPAAKPAATPAAAPSSEPSATDNTGDSDSE